MLPTEINFPIPEELFTEGSKYNIETYLQELNERLSDMYQQISQNVNGFIKPWTPVVLGLTTSGTGTYINQYGWVRRAGIITECWMDVSWSAHTGTGNVAIQMPYQAANSSGSPFIGIIESSATNTFAPFTYLTWRVEPNSTNGVIIESESGVASANLSLGNSRGFRGYIRYIGKEFE